LTKRKELIDKDFVDSGIVQIKEDRATNILNNTQPIEKVNNEPILIKKKIIDKKKYTPKV